MLTRKKLRTHPPDILFTTTEMLNRNLGDASYRGLFGIKTDVQPRLVLLDEVHTYGGIHGAQVGMLLRRWRWAGYLKSHYVGLSATLLNAPEFFASLTGLLPARVAETSVRREDLIEEGREHMLALRADPLSRTATLSTTIQTAMLLGRLLESAPQRHNTDTISDALKTNGTCSPSTSTASRCERSCWGG